MPAYWWQNKPSFSGTWPALSGNAGGSGEGEGGSSWEEATLLLPCRRHQQDGFGPSACAGVRSVATSVVLALALRIQGCVSRYLLVSVDC